MGFIIENIMLIGWRQLIMFGVGIGAMIDFGQAGSVAASGIVLSLILRHLAG